MLSIPRDLQVDIPGVGLSKMNAAYSYGGPALVIKTFKQVTGLPVNGWIEVNFSGFWHVVNILGGVYLPIDHKYFVPASADYKSINLEPGYQLVRGKQALNYVRFRHDELCDFGRMQRQQLFLKEVQRQSGRWSSDWTKVLRLIKAITGETKSSLSSLKKIQPLVRARVPGRHLQGVPGSPRGRERRRSTGRRTSSATEAEVADVVAPVHQSDAAAGQDQGRQDRQEDVQREGVQRQRHRRAGDQRRDAVGGAGLQGARPSPTPTSTPTRSLRCTRRRASRRRPRPSPP